MLLVSLALCLAGAIVADPGVAQPVGGPVTGGPTTGGNDPTGNNTTGGNTTGGNTTGGNVNTGGNVGVNVGGERRYIVEFVSFKALDETGCDLCGSDEVQLIVRTDGYALLSSWYGNVDSNRLAHRFIRCAQPAVDGDGVYDHEWECDQGGKAPPFSLTVAAYEDDGDYPFTGFCAENIPTVNGRDSDIFPPSATFCVEGRGELIGKGKVELKLEDLNDLVAPGQSFDRTIDLIGGCDSTETPCSSGGAPHYTVRYVVKRVPDATGGAPVDPNP
jgi:hypothetical protein